VKWSTNSQLQLSRIAISAGVKCHRHFGVFRVPTFSTLGGEHRSHAMLSQGGRKHRFPRGAGHRPEIPESTFLSLTKNSSNVNVPRVRLKQ
jgi:hypothetical protein